MKGDASAEPGVDRDAPDDLGVKQLGALLATDLKSWAGSRWFPIMYPRLRRRPALARAESSLPPNVSARRAPGLDRSTPAHLYCCDIDFGD